jgi:hypothetical protein
MFNAWNVLPKRCNHDCLPPPSWKQRARDYMKKKNGIFDFLNFSKIDGNEPTRPNFFLFFLLFFLQEAINQYLKDKKGIQTNNR